LLGKRPLAAQLWPRRLSCVLRQSDSAQCRHTPGRVQA